MKSNQVLLILLSWLLAHCAPHVLRAQNAPPPNIILIVIDDMGYGDIGCYGNNMLATPHIDRLAAEGIMFTQFYANAPICSPSRVAFTTGQYPARHGIHSYLASKSRNKRRKMRNFLQPDVPTLARSLQQAGYATGHFGKWHMGGGRDVQNAPAPSAYGFDESFVDNFEGMGPGKHHQAMPKSHSSDIYFDEALAFIERHQHQPFYLNIWPNDLHDPFVAKQELLRKYESFSENPYQQQFNAVLDNLDQQIGRFMKALSEMGLDKQSIIIFTSDNGPTDWPHYYRSGHQPPGSTGDFRGRKWSLYEGGIRVPFIVRWKGHIPEGKTNTKSILAAMDLFPSLCSIAQVPLPAAYQLDGLDMSAALMGKRPKRDSPIFWEYARDRNYLRPGNADFASPNMAIRDGKWKLLMNDDGMDMKLYDLEKDPAETNNLATTYPERVRKLYIQLMPWRKSLPVFESEKSNNR